jgi:rRNA maturation endonuclease Nob1
MCVNVPHRVRMSVRQLLPIMTDGGTDPANAPRRHAECRDCGLNLTVDTDECPDCGGEIAVYDVS